MTMIFYTDLQERLPALEKELRELIAIADDEDSDFLYIVPAWVRKGLEDLREANQLPFPVSECLDERRQRLRDFALNVAIGGLPKGDLSELVEQQTPSALEFAWDWATVAAQLGSEDAERLLLLLAARAQPGEYGSFLREAFQREKEKISWKTPLPSSNKAEALRENRRRIYVLELGLQAVVRQPDDLDLARSVKAVCRDYARTIGDIPESLFLLTVELDRVLAQDEPAGKGPQRRVLRSLTPSSRSDERQNLERFRALLRPIPFTLWPEDRAWAQRLREEFPWMDTVIDTVERQQALCQSVGALPLRVRPMLLLGPAGTGKTRFLRRLGEVLSVPTIFLPLAGSADNMMLKGSARGWSSARPGYLVESMLERRCPNPLVVLDEIEKIGIGRINGRVWETLLTLLEPSSSSAVLDEYLLGQVDYSAINWVATANGIEDLPVPLRSRFDIIEVGYPNGSDFDRILDSIVRDIARSLGVDPWALPPLENEVKETLRARFQRNPRSLRQLRQLVARLMEMQALAERSAGNALRAWQ